MIYSFGYRYKSQGDFIHSPSSSYTNNNSVPNKLAVVDEMEVGGGMYHRHHADGRQDDDETSDDCYVININRIRI